MLRPHDYGRSGVCVRCTADELSSGSGLCEDPRFVTFAFDYDGTWTRDPEGLRAVVKLLQGRGHTCILLTGRSDEERWGHEVRAAIGDLMPIVFAGNTWKRDAALAAGYKVDIFCDDLPEYIAAQDLRRTVGRPKIVEEGWVDLEGGARLHYEAGEPVELATNTRAQREATGGHASAKLEALHAASDRLGYEVEPWGAWAMHPVDTRLYVRVWKGTAAR